jgi:16S rRNA (uracil1498-N3)-methyltransferase
VIEASKQCGRNRLLEISEPKDWEHTVQEVSPDRMRWLAESNGIPLKSVWPARNSATSTDRPSPQPSLGARGSRIITAIGPEGGFTDEEMNSALAAGWTAVSLGPRILRVETAALAIAAWVAAESAGNWPASG